jgi:butyryl-CoA dehydrogenase
MEQKVTVEGSIALLSYCTQLVDQQVMAEDAVEKERLTLLLELLTPVAKSWPSEYTLEANKHAIQILGGYGYTREYPVERHYRDNRLNPIHEGTHGIQGMDLLGRKVNLAGGKALDLLGQEIQSLLDEVSGIPQFEPLAASLKEAWQDVTTTVSAVNDHADVLARLANATPFLDAFGHVVIAWLWLWQAVIAQRALENEPSVDADFYQGKLAACTFFYRYHLPQAREKLSYVGSMDRTALDAKATWFTGG